jgi:hypothetical protein
VLRAFSQRRGLLPIETLRVRRDAYGFGDDLSRGLLVPLPPAERVVERGRHGHAVRRRRRRLPGDGD